MVNGQTSLKILRELGEKLHPHLCNAKYFKPNGFRARIGRLVLGNPRRGQGILVQVDLAYKTKEEVDNFWKGLEYLSKAGIKFDTGMGCKFDMEFDWSLKGAIAICKKCGYNSEENKMWLDIWNKREHFTTDCTKCGKILDSSDGFWHFKKHFWNKTKYYHTECYQEMKQ